MSEKKEFKAFEFKIDDASENNDVGYIEGYASTFGNIDLGLDVVMPGAFKRTISQKKGKFPILLDHNPYKQIGWNIEASEDERGLKVKGEILLVTEEAKNRYILAKKALEYKTKMGLSIGYSTVKQEITKDPDPTKPVVRKLKELKLYEYSLVTFPMNEEASITGAKAEEWDAVFALMQERGYDPIKIKQALEAVLKDEPSQPAITKADSEMILHSVDKLIREIKAD